MRTTIASVACCALKEQKKWASRLQFRGVAVINDTSMLIDCEDVCRVLKSDSKTALREEVDNEGELVYRRTQLEGGKTLVLTLHR